IMACVKHFALYGAGEAGRDYNTVDMSRNRPTGPGTRVYMRATTDPGGIGHGWVKARFITPAPPGTPIVETVTVRLPDGTDQQM
ncbi:hypothetical protein VSS86_21725, partial [Bacillus safensis]|uniref:hypothetical protein n=1 Tax=Bacillus safensis TaxID=561879 RepID=UPI002DD45181